MDSTDHVPREELGNDLRRDIFVTLLETGDALTPSEIGERVDSERQQVQYHLDKLVRMGLVVPDDGEYYVQPLFLDGDYEREVITSLSSLVPVAEEKIEVGEDIHPADEQTILLNCVRLSVAMHVK